MIKRLINLQTWVLSLALAGVLFGCAKDSEDSVDADKSAYVTIRMPAKNNGIATRAGGVDEIAIKQAYVVVYAGGAGGADTPKFASKVELANIIDDVVNTKKILVFKPTDNIAEGDDINIIFNKVVENLAIPKKDLLTALKLTSVNDGLVSLNDGLPMYGKGEWTAAGSPLIAIKRSVAKVQLKLDYDGGKHVPGDMGSGFTTANTTYKLYQLSDVGSIDGINNSVISSTGSKVITEIAAGADINEPSSQMLKDNNDNYIGANYIYAYPYSTKSIGNPTTALVVANSSIERIAMIMKNTGGGRTTYHRLDFYDEGGKKYLDILNNHHYIVKIREVSQGGYLTETDALNQPASNVKFDIIVEEEGTVIVSNGQYALNVNELGSEFEVTSAETTINLAQVSRQTSINAPMIKPTPFSVTLEDVLRIGNFAIALKDVPSTLDNNVKDLKITASGDGLAMFRYTAKLGNIEHKSEVITLKSEGGVITLEGFIPDADKANGYAVNKKFDVLVGNGYKYKVTSSFKQEWDATLTTLIPTTLPTKFTKSLVTASVAEFSPVANALGGFYLNVYRTAPGDIDITRSISVIATSPDNSVCQHTFNVKIVTSCKLPTQSENYSITINNFKVADRNVGSKLPTASYLTANKYFTNQTDHPDYIAGSIGCSVGDDSSIWNKQKPAISAIAGEYYAHTPISGMASAHIACSTFGLGSGSWRLPDENKSGTTEIKAMATQVRHSKYRAYLLSTESTSKPAEDTLPAFVEYSGVFLPIVGYSSAPTSVISDYWSSATIGINAYSLAVKSMASGVINGYDTSYGFNARCVSE